MKPGDLIEFINEFDGFKSQLNNVQTSLWDICPVSKGDVGILLNVETGNREEKFCEVLIRDKIIWNALTSNLKLLASTSK